MSTNQTGPHLSSESTPGNDQPPRKYGPAGWRDRMSAWAYAARSRFEAHPWVLAVSLPDPPALPSQIQWTERGLDALQPTRLAETEKRDLGTLT